MASKLDEARKIINEVDAQMAELFLKRMHAAEMVYEHKKEFGLPILDEKREAAVIEKNSALIEDGMLKGYYIDYLKHLMSVSRAYQYRMQNGLNVAYSGVEGAFAHIAAGRIFPG
ncbi:MAG: chorismate mutase, partial [Oscillospiraceae bacterium]|nr:chorismate mutase [Oscillospiraceae bacterium]